MYRVAERRVGKGTFAYRNGEQRTMRDNSSRQTPALSRAPKWVSSILDAENCSAEDTLTHLSQQRSVTRFTKCFTIKRCCSVVTASLTSCISLSLRPRSEMFKLILCVLKWLQQPACVLLYCDTFLDFRSHLSRLLSSYAPVLSGSRACVTL